MQGETFLIGKPTMWVIFINAKLYIQNAEEPTSYLQIPLIASSAF